MIYVSTPGTAPTARPGVGNTKSKLICESMTTSKPNYDDGDDDDDDDVDDDDDNEGAQLISVNSCWLIVYV